MNGWSWSIGRFFGIDTRVHATFLLLVGWAAFSTIEQGGTAFAAIISIGFLLAVFASVLLHELGHALTGRLFGIETRTITLSPLGGLAQLEAGMLPPRAELWIALAGPLVSFLLAGVFFTLAALTGEWSPSSFVGGLGWANLMIAAFNMLPAFPMDGGRVLRAGMAGRLGYRRATEIAARVGKVAAIGMMILGLFTRPLLLMIGVFVYLAASAEASAVRRFFAFGGGGGGGRRVRRSPRTSGAPTWYERWRKRSAAQARAGERQIQRIIDPGPPAGRRSEDERVIDPRIVYVRSRGRGGDPDVGGRRVRVYLDLH